MDLAPIPLVARGGVLVLGGGRAGRPVAGRLGAAGATVVEPAPPPRISPQVEVVAGSAVALDADRRLVGVETLSARVHIAYAQLVVAVGGVAGSLAGLGLPRDAGGRVRVDENLRVLGAPNIWALGDCAALPQGAPHALAPTALATFYRGGPELGRSGLGIPRCEHSREL